MSRNFLYPDIETKQCRCCLKLKPINEFYPAKQNVDGVKSYCDKCCNSKVGTWREKNRIKIKEYNFRAKIKRNYGITYEQYEEILKSQDFSCSICKVHISKLNRRLHVDHNHSTGKVRGLLCGCCNTAIGQLKENIHNFTNAISYLKKED